MEYRWKVKSYSEQGCFDLSGINDLYISTRPSSGFSHIAYFKTKKDAMDCLKDIYLTDHVPFFELDCHGKRNGFPFKEFLTDFKITRV